MRFYLGEFLRIAFRGVSGGEKGARTAFFYELFRIMVIGFCG